MATLAQWIVQPKLRSGQLFTLDWKTTKTKNRSGLPYQNQPEQVSSYAAAYYGAERVEAGEIWGANAYLSTDEVDSDGNAKFKVISYPPEELAKHWDTFKCILELSGCAGKNTIHEKGATQ